MSTSVHSSTIDYREISVLSDEILQELITAHELIRRDDDNPHTRAELAAIRIFAAFTFGIRKWDDGLLERSRVAVNGNVQQNGGSGGVGEGHRMLARMVERLREGESRDPLLANILAECLRIGRPGRVY